MIKDIIISPLKVIDVPGGDVLHAMKCNEVGYSGFGEAYFSCIEPGVIKAWKRHREMVLNLVVPIGEIRFVIYDDCETSLHSDRFQEIILSKKNYCRLTVPPMLWMGFQCVSKEDSMLLNIASIQHDPDEVDRKAIEGIQFDWGVKK